MSMRRLALILGVATATVWVAGGSAAAPIDPLDPADPLVAGVRSLHDEIALANLIRGLGLTAEQRAALADRAAAADGIRDVYRVRAAPLLAEADSAFRALRDELLAGDAEPAAETRRRAIEAQHALQAERAALFTELAVLEDDVRAVLDEGQALLVEQFQPCLVPPESFGDPARIGQSGAGTRALELLDGVRRMPPTTYERRLPALVDRGIERVEWIVGPLTDDAEQRYRDELASVFAAARAMDDLTFAVEGPTLAEQLKAPVDDALGNAAHRSGDGSSATRLTRVGGWLLAPGAAEVLAALAAN